MGLSTAHSRLLTVIAQDPGVRQRGEIVTARLEVPAENLGAGPVGHRIHVIDYDATRDQFVRPAPVCDEDPFENASSDELVQNPHFHAQNAYAITSATLARFEAALGRRVRWGFGRGHQLKVAPHAFADANAYYSREDECLAFGYFSGKQGQPVYTCLSHDIIAHETTHALLDGVRTHFLLPSSPQQAGFHEGFADIVALLSVFRLPEAVRAALRGKNGSESRVMKKEDLTVAKLRESSLLRLAEQMGDQMAGVRGTALRDSAQLTKNPRPPDSDEPHELGEVLVAAMLLSFLEVWVRRLFPHGPEGVQSLDRTHVIEEGARAAGHLLTMAIRALDYTPPVDLQFDDFLSALLTADSVLNPNDSKYRYREALRESFAAFGIRPATRGEGLWDAPLKPANYNHCRHEAMQSDPEEMWRFVWQNRDTLGLETDVYTYIESVRPTKRVNADGFVVHETVAEYVQVLDVRADELGAYGLTPPVGMRPYARVVLYGGASLIFDDFGRLKFQIGSRLRSNEQQRRLQYLYEAGRFSPGYDVRSVASMHRARVGGPGPVDPYAQRGHS